MISFDEPVADPASVQVSDSDQLLLFPFRWNTEAVASNYTTVRAVVHDFFGKFVFQSSPQMRVALLFLYLGTNFEFEAPLKARFLVVVEWRNLTFSCCPEEVGSNAHQPASQAAMHALLFLSLPTVS